MQSSKLPNDSSDQSSKDSPISYEKLVRQFRKEVEEKSGEYDQCTGKISKVTSWTRRFEVDCKTAPDTYSHFSKRFPILHGTFFSRPLEYKHITEFSEDTKSITSETIDVKKYTP